MKYVSLIILFTVLANSDIKKTMNQKELDLTKVAIKNKKIIYAEKDLQSILQKIKKYKKIKIFRLNS